MWAAYIAYAVEGAGGVLDWYVVEGVLSHVVRLFFVEGGETGVCMSMISLEERGFRSCGEGLRIDDGVANGTLCD